MIRLFDPTALAAALLLAASPITWAQPIATPARPDVWSVYDRDHDGHLDRAEFYAHRQAMLASGRPGWARRFETMQFDAIDRDADGLISEAEMLDALRSHVRQRRRYGWDQ
jgi:hypothetical protein